MAFRAALLSLAAFAATLFLSTASADSANGWFVTGGVSIVQLQGSSDTTTGGAVFGGGGTAHNVSFGSSYAFDAMIGRNIIDTWSLGLSYNHLETDVDFYASFPCCDASRYFGNATSDIIMLNAIYSAPLWDLKRWNVHAAAGVGVALNELDVYEDFPAWDGIPDMDVEKGDRSDLALKASLGVSYAVGGPWGLYANVSLFDIGAFETGDTRSAPLEDIGPYKLDTWGYSLGIGASARF